MIVDLNCHGDLSLTGKEGKGFRGQPKPEVDLNGSAWSQLSVVAVNTAVSPGFALPHGGSKSLYVEHSTVMSGFCS